MTNNVKDFMPLASRAPVAAEHHYGLLFTSERSTPGRGDAIGRFVRRWTASYTATRVRKATLTRSNGLARR